MTAVLVIGLGRIGSMISMNLMERGVDVIVSDIYKEKIEKLRSYFETKIINVTDLKDVALKTKDVDYVITALPGPIAYKGIYNLLKTGKNVIDISFYPENVWNLDEVARGSRVIYIPDAGLAPGLSNILAGRIDYKLEGAKSINIYVGGVSYEPDDILGLALTWSPIDLVDEYIRPARIRKDGKILAVDPLSITGTIKIPRIGEMEFFVSDGLRTTLKTMKHVRNMKELTLRYKGHFEKIKFLRKLGLFTNGNIIYDKMRLELNRITSLLLDEYITNKYKDKVILYVYGEKKNREIKYFLEKSYDAERKISAMAMTTGYTAATIAEIALKGLIQGNGIIPPELLGKNKEFFKMFLKIMKEKSVVIKKL